tara:strand:+ start:1085 stop:3802 length:2718 start_codon:yes stop_codon:yes gene_type:complete
MSEECNSHIQTFIKKPKKKYDTLYDFLNIVRVAKGHEYTHTSMCMGSYYIRDDQREKFNELYYRYVFEEGKKAFLTEKHREIAPILIDLDLKFTPDKKARQYTDDHIRKTILAYREFLQKYVDFEIEEQYYAFVFEKTKPVLSKNKKNKIIKDGIHIMFPYLNLEYPLQFMMREHVIKKCPEIFGDIDLFNSYDDVVDESVIRRNNWLMYGSRKPDRYGIEQESYKLTKIYNTQGDSLPEIECNEENYPIKKLLKILSIQDGGMRQELCKVNEQYRDDIVEYGIANKRKIRKKRKHKTSRRKKIIRKVDKNESLEVYRKLVKILSPERAEGYRTWYDLGLCLHNIDHRLLSDWIEFSKQSPKYTEGECQIEWDIMDVDDLGLGLGSLYMWAREDNRTEFNKIVSGDLRTHLYRSLKGCTHHDIAKVIHTKYSHEFVCVSNKSKEWYQFKNHRWRRIDNGVFLRNKLSKEIVAEYLDYGIYCGEQAKMKPDEEDIWAERAKTCYKLINQLKTTNFKEKIMKECADMFYVHDFLEKLDSKKDLIGFENGVYDLNKEEFRDGFPEDYISLSTKIDYIEFTEEDEADEMFIRGLLDQIFPIKAVRHFTLKFLGSCLSGSTREETIHFWTGSGSNGKSVVIDLFRNGFGDYSCIIPVSIFTHARAASNACTPELARTKGKRFVLLQEPDAGESFRAGLLKELTGGDKIMARSLHKEPIEFKPQFTPVMICNDLPDIRMDGGVERRLRVVPFISKFVENPDPAKPHQYLKDGTIKDRIDDGEWADVFMRIMIEKYKQYKREGLKVPNEVKVKTNDYKKQCDVVSRFIDEMIEEDPKASVKLMPAFIIFKSWAQAENLRAGRRTDFKKAIAKRFGPYIKGRWRGIRIREQTDDTEQSDSGDGDGDNHDVVFK